MSVTALSEYTFQSRYSQYDDTLKRKETWGEAVKRIFDMHRDKYAGHIEKSEELKNLVDFAEKEYKKKHVIGSQRNLQFGGEPTIKHNLKSFNCTYTLADRPRVFQEILFTLLCGSGVGVSVRKRHVGALPGLVARTKNSKKFEIEDSIEGWADAVGVLYSSFVNAEKAVFPEFSGHAVEFDFSKIRPKGALIANRFKAPGPDGLRQSLEKVEVLLNGRVESGDLRPIDCYDIVAHISDAVLSGGIRRCLPKGSKVFLKDGVRNIEDVRVGDMALTSKGYKKVLNNFDQGKQSLIKIVTQDGDFECTPNHKMAVLTGFETYEWKCAEDLAAGDRLITNTKAVDGVKTKLPEFKFIKNKKDNTSIDIKIPKLDQNMAHFLGNLHGDGYVLYVENRKEHGADVASRVSIACDMTYPDQHTFLCEQMQRFGVKAQIKPRKGENCVNIECSSKQLAKYFYDNFKQPKTNIEIPQCIWNASTEIKLAYISGILDSDGCVKNRPIKVVNTIYEQFAKDIQNLLYSCGISTRLNHLKSKTREALGWKRIYQVSLINRKDAKILDKHTKFKKLISRTKTRAGSTFPSEWIAKNKIFKGKKGALGAFANEKVTADALNDKGFEVNLRPTEILRIEAVKTQKKTFDIEVEDAHEFYCNGYLTHNSALIILFDQDDQEMMNAKTGDWFINNPQRARSNNSACVVRQTCTKEQFDKLIECARGAGEPGFFFCDEKDLDSGANPSLAGDTIVYTQDLGNLPIQQLENRKFKVKTVTGDVANASCVKSGANKSLTQISLSNDRHIYATPEHKWPIFKENQLVNVKTQNLKKGDLLVKNPKPETDIYEPILDIKTDAKTEDVWDISVEHPSHSFPIEWCFTGNCLEISLYPKTKSGQSGFSACVAGETKLITRDGVEQIQDCVGRQVEVWNGEEWSKATPVVTGKNKQFYRVQLSDGSYLDCTENHRFLVKNRFEKIYREVTTKFLFENLTNEKYRISTPRTEIEYEEGIQEPRAYEYGLFIGDGSLSGKKLRIDLYNKKRSLPIKFGTLKNKNKKPFNSKSSCVYDQYYLDLDFDLCKRFKKETGLPKEIFSWDKQSILQFVAGWADTDGSQASKGIRIYGEQNNISDLQLLLTKVGINSSQNVCYEAGGYEMILGNKANRNQAVHYVQITKTDKIPCHRLVCNNTKEARLKGKKQIIRSVTKLDRIDTSYCLEEPKKHQCLFNNVLTLQCNLSEVNGKFAKDEETFYKQCKAASIIGTLQAGYTDFEYLGDDTEEIIEREALLGVSITGLMDNPEVLFDPKIQKRGAEIVNETNRAVAKLIKINPAARTTCIKPSGSASILLESASGIHAHHARRYLRRIQSNEEESSLAFFKQHNPLAVEKSVWSATGTDYSVIFPCEVPKGAIVNNQISALEFLEKIKSTQLNWVKTGTNKELCAIPYLEHNVSSTVTVKDDEWEDVSKFLYENRYHFTGVSLLSLSGDLDYHQSPRASVLTPNELVKEYGDASVFASGLVVDGLAAFNDNLWAACDAAIGIGEDIKDELEEPSYPKQRNYKALSSYFEAREQYESWFAKKDWVRRLNQFAERYFDGDLRRATYCCKHVSLWKTWVDLRREYKEVDWSQMECGPEYQNADEQAAAACSGGACEIV